MASLGGGRLPVEPGLEGGLLTPLWPFREPSESSKDDFIFVFSPFSAGACPRVSNLCGGFRSIPFSTPFKTGFNPVDAEIVR